MEWTVSFDGPGGAAVVTTRGVFNALDHARMVADIVSRAPWYPGRPVLFDHRELDFGTADFQQMYAARDNHLTHDARIGRSRSAILMRSLVDFGRGRQFELMGNGSITAELAIFMDEGAAWSWLANEPGTDGTVR